MREKQLTVATYAAGASLAAIALVYVFAPSFLIDAGAESDSSSRKLRVVGLVNPANDCFINSTCQALAGLTDLRLYLIRETHIRALDSDIGSGATAPPAGHNGSSNPKMEGLRSGIVTFGLKELIDALNERPIYKKTITVAPFVKCLESAFRQRISRQQQDAQEFLQIVSERLRDEFHARHKEQPPSDTEGGFPLEGVSESQIECLHCGFKPAPNLSPFTSLTLHVPAVSSTTLSNCFDSVFHTETIGDYKCEKCAHQGVARHVRINSFPKVLALHLSRSIYNNSTSAKNAAKVSFPEALSLGGLLQQKKYKMRSAIMHRGSHNSGHYETFRKQQNTMPYANRHPFAESKVYSRTTAPDTSTPATPCLKPASGNVEEPEAKTDRDSVGQAQESLSRGLGIEGLQEERRDESNIAIDENDKFVEEAATLGTDGDSTRQDLSESSSVPQASASTSPSSTSEFGHGTRLSKPGTADDNSSLKSKMKESRLNLRKLNEKRQRRKAEERWWRISDDKVKESKTSEVLGMQREVYLLFYELERKPGMDA